MTTKSDIVDRVRKRVKDIPTAITDTDIENFVEDAKYDLIANGTISIDLDDIEDKYVGLLTNATSIYVLCYMYNVGISYNLGRIRVDKRTEIEGIDKLINFLVNRVNSQLNNMGGWIKHNYTQPYG